MKGVSRMKLQSSSAIAMQKLDKSRALQVIDLGGMQ